MPNICNGLGKEIKSLSALAQKKGRGIVTHNGNEWISSMHGKATLGVHKNERESTILILLIKN